MNRLRSKLLLLFLAATLVPLAVTLWITASLLETSLGYATTGELDELSRSLQITGRELYQRTREDMRRDIEAGRLTPQHLDTSNPVKLTLAQRDFLVSEEPNRFTLAGDDGDRLQYLVRHGNELLVYERALGGVGLNRLTRQFSRARQLVSEARGLDLRRGFIIVLIAGAALVWVAALVVVIAQTNRISKPIRQITQGLEKLATGELSVRLPETGGEDEVSRAIQAFNHTAGQLEESRERAAFAERVTAWQALARKMAHELKNSLTPIRLTMEEMLARRGDATDPQFFETAAQIVVDEVGTLERRVRAFTDFSSEPPVHPHTVDLNQLIEERVALLKTAHPGLRYELDLNDTPTPARADEDLVKGILTNLLENAADAAGTGGIVKARTTWHDGHAIVEVHDSGGGLNATARETLFEPTISFKKNGMGLGLSIARKSALRMGGDIVLLKGDLGGAGFRVTLPAGNGSKKNSDR